MRYARIENGKVMELGDFDSIEGRFHPSLLWIPCDASVQQGWLYDGAAFSAPLPVSPSLVPLAQAALTKTDAVAVRCYKAGVPFPAAWQTYVASLRAIANGTDTASTALPPQPAYPAGA